MTTNQTTTTTRTAITSRAAQLQAMLQHTGLDIQNPEEWETLVSHVEVHKYLINGTIGWTIRWEDAVFSWYENVYSPLIRAIASWEVKNAFSGLTPWQLYNAVSGHWYYLLERDDSIDAETAALDFAAHYGHGLAAWFSRFLTGSAG